ncbi:MAG: hypothetical protein J5872_05340 [Lachnospiraceae bacterium]|nr:hypothetical protein [Lachnospiraceae bacterium]
MMNQNPIPDYEREYRQAKRKRLFTVWFGRAISFAFLPLTIWGFHLVSLDSEDEAALVFLGLVFLFYGAYWTWGSFGRFIARKRQKKKLRLAFLKKAAYEEGLPVCGNFYFNATEGLSDRLIDGSGLLLPAGPDVKSLFALLSGLGTDANSEYMSGVCNGIPFERATVDMTPLLGRYEVNWMVFTLPYNTGTSLRYMSGEFAQRHLASGLFDKAIYAEPSGMGGLYHIAGEAPTEELKDMVLSLSGSIQDDCEILVLGNQVHVLLRRDGYVSDLPAKARNLSEEQIRRQVAGRIGELSQCSASLGASITEAAAAAKRREEEASRRRSH